MLIFIPSSGVTLTSLGTKIARICLTAISAFAIARLTIGPIFVALWPGLYWGWDCLGRRRAAHGLGTFLWNAEQKSPTAPFSHNRSGLRRVVRIIGFTIAAITLAGVLLVFLSIEFDQRRAKETRAKIQEGMTVKEVLYSTGTGAFLWANSDDPETDLHNPRAVNLAPGSEAGKFIYFDDVLSKNREISAPEVVALFHQRLGDGYPWRVEYFFAGHSLEHFSFKVVFDKDGRVRDVTPLYGSFE